MKNWKKGSRRWLRFSLLMAPVKKLREVFVLHPVMEKNLSRFLKIHFRSPGIGFGRRHTEQAKMGDFLKNIGESGFFFREGGIPDPP
jgi:hypothetical protein